MYFALYNVPEEEEEQRGGGGGGKNKKQKTKTKQKTTTTPQAGSLTGNYKRLRERYTDNMEMEEPNWQQINYLFVFCNVRGLKKSTFWKICILSRFV